METVEQEDLVRIQHAAKTAQFLEVELKCEQARMNKAIVEALHKKGYLAGSHEIDQKTGEIKEVK